MLNPSERALTPGKRDDPPPVVSGPGQASLSTPLLLAQPTPSVANASYLAALISLADDLAGEAQAATLEGASAQTAVLSSWEYQAVSAVNSILATMASGSSMSNFSPILSTEAATDASLIPTTQSAFSESVSSTSISLTPSTTSTPIDITSSSTVASSTDAKQSKSVTSTASQTQSSEQPIWTSALASDSGASTISVTASSSLVTSFVTLFQQTTVSNGRTLVQPITSTVISVSSVAVSVSTSVAGATRSAIAANQTGPVISITPMKISTGAIVSIAIGAILLIGLLIALCICCCKRDSYSTYRRRRDSRDDEAHRPWTPISNIRRLAKVKGGSRPDNLPDGIDSSLQEPKSPSKYGEAETLRTRGISFFLPAKPPAQPAKSIRDDTTIFDNAAGVGAAKEARESSSDQTVLSASGANLSQHDRPAVLQAGKAAEVKSIAPRRTVPPPPSRKGSVSSASRISKPAASASKAGGTSPPTISKAPTLPLPYERPARSAI